MPIPTRQSLKHWANNKVQRSRERIVLTSDVKKTTAFDAFDGGVPLSDDRVTVSDLFAGAQETMSSNLYVTYTVCKQPAFNHINLHQ